MKLHIFNPENDMALANGSPGYTAPANIQAYRKQNWDLPKLWAEPGDIVWDGESSLAPFFADGERCPELCPWGWSPALVHQLELAGVPRGLMPDNEYLAKLRILSGRESTVPVQNDLGVEACVCHTAGQVEECLVRWDRVVMKSPWSSSGKGLMQTDNPNWKGWVQRILRQQGSVVVERYVSGRLDFALEFWLCGGVAEYAGLNVFRTDAHGHFIENVNDGEIPAEYLVTSLLSRPSCLVGIRNHFLQLLPQLAPWYDGAVGVDMMVLTDGTLHPCVEINWRMTMGMVEVMAKGKVKGENGKRKGE